MRHPTFLYIYTHFSTQSRRDAGKDSINFAIMEPIGTLIRRELDRQERTVTWFARKLSCDRSNVYRLFQKHSIDTILLYRISQILEHDFFADLSDSLPAAVRCPKS